MTKILLIASASNFREELRSLIGKCDPECRVIEEASSIAESRHLLATLSPDCLFVEANLPDGTCFDLLDGISKESCQVVIMADDPASACQAFEYNVADYLRIPVKQSELSRALEKLRRFSPTEQLKQQLQLLMRGNQQKQMDRLILHLSEGIHILPLNETIRLESDGCYTSFFTANGERIVVTRAIGEFEHLTETGPFFRVHQSHIVNLNFVRKVLKEDGGFVVLDSGVKVPIARRRKEEFFQCVIKHSTT